MGGVGGIHPLVTFRHLRHRMNRQVGSQSGSQSVSPSDGDPMTATTVVVSVSLGVPYLIGLGDPLLFFFFSFRDASRGWRQMSSPWVAVAIRLIPSSFPFRSILRSASRSVVNDNNGFLFLCGGGGARQKREGDVRVSRQWWSGSVEMAARARER